MQYKLIKEYPNSPKIGTVHTNDYYNNFWKGENFYSKYPEFWEKISISITTEDGGSLEEGEYYYAVDPTTYEIVPSVVDYNSSSSKWKKFFNIVEARKYVSSKQCCLTIEDVIAELKERNLI